MGGLDLLGAVGKGLTQGSAVIQANQKLKLQEQQQADQAAYRDGVLKIAQEDQTFQREDRAVKEAERQRLAGYEQLVRETAAELGEDVTPEQLGAEILKRGLRDGRIPQKEVEPLMKQAKAFRQPAAAGRACAAARRGATGERPVLDREVRVESTNCSFCWLTSCAVDRARTQRGGGGFLKAAMANVSKVESNNAVLPG